MYAVVRWQGDIGLCSIEGFDPEGGRFEDLKPGWEALREYAGIKTATGGPRAMSKEDAFEQAVAFGLEWLADHPDKQPAAFSIQQFATMRCTGIDATYNWMKDKKFGIKRVRQELARRKQ